MGFDQAWLTEHHFIDDSYSPSLFNVGAANRRTDQPDSHRHPEDVIAQIEDYRSRSRLTHLVCAMALPGMPPHHIRAGMELFAGKVIPHFRDR